MTGEPLRTITTVGKVFAQPVQANGKLFVADGSGRLTAFEPLIGRPPLQVRLPLSRSGESPAQGVGGLHIAIG